MKKSINKVKEYPSEYCGNVNTLKVILLAIQFVILEAVGPNKSKLSFRFADIVVGVRHFPPSAPARLRRKSDNVLLYKTRYQTL